jgi:hypothetical protein
MRLFMSTDGSIDSLWKKKASISSVVSSFDFVQILMPLFVLPTAQLLHEPSSTFWQNEIKRRTYAGQIRQRADVSSRVNADGMQKLRGDDVVADLRRMLRDGFGVKRSSTQVLIHQAFIEAMLPKIYQGEWDENKGRIL